MGKVIQLPRRDWRVQPLSLDIESVNFANDGSAKKITGTILILYNGKETNINFTYMNSLVSIASKNSFKKLNVRWEDHELETIHADIILMCKSILHIQSKFEVFIEHPKIFNTLIAIAGFLVVLCWLK